MRTTISAFLAVLALSAALPARVAAVEARQAVYVNLADSLEGSLDELTGSLRRSFEASGWSVVALHDAGVDRAACAFRARVIALAPPEYVRKVLANGPIAAFALPVRILLYEDEAGTHLATVNPHSINRTIISETGFESPSEALMRDLVRITSSAVSGRFAVRPYGQIRERGLIGRTMGIMAGGPFPDKVKTVWSAPGASAREVEAVANRVWDGLERGSGRGKWQIRGLYRLDLPEQGVVVMGVSGVAMEAKSYAIVGAGNDGRRSRYRCPGIAHAAAYPIEVLVYHDETTVRVAVIDGMYRMKMYFEDAGKMKFAANMTMPGSIEDEIRDLVLAGVGAKR